MLKKASAVSINVGIWVFDLSDLSENTWNGFEADSGQVANVVVFNVSIGKFLQMHEPWVGVSEDGVSITWNNST
jgi:hypothetical protein